MQRHVFMFAIFPLAVGCSQDPGMRIARPRQIYVGPTLRDYAPIGQRKPAG